MKAAILAITLQFTGLSVMASDIPAPFESSYSIHSKGIRLAKMKQQLRKSENGEYIYRTETRTTGLISLFRKDQIIEQSTMYLNGHQIKPLRYSYVHSGGKKDRNVSIEFDWTRNRITTSVNGAPWQAQIQPGILDKLIYQLALIQDLKTGKKPLEYTIADGGKIKTYHFNMLGEEPLKTSLGVFQTVKLERHRPDGKRKTTLWCAEKLNYLPVKVEHIEKDGRKTTAFIESLTGFEF